MPMLNVRGEPFNIEIDGPADAPPLLLSNSLSSDLSMWDDQIPAWAARFPVARYDQREHGRSVVPPGRCLNGAARISATALLKGTAGPGRFVVR